MINLSLPYPPTVNHYYRHVGYKTLISEAGREYRKTIAKLVLTADRSKLPLAGDLEMTIEVYPPDKRRRDLDNILKSLFDALEKARVYNNDSQIAKLHVIRCNVVTNGLVQVKIETVKEEA